MITVQREAWGNCIQELMPLCQKVFEIAEQQFTGLDLDFDVDLYQACENVGRFHCLVMRKNGAAIGFHWVFISPMMRHKNKLHAHTDAIFVEPAHRNHSKLLIEFSEKYISEKADFWTLANLNENNRQAMWQRRGFSPIETIMFKKL